MTVEFIISFLLLVNFLPDEEDSIIYSLAKPFNVYITLHLDFGAAWIKAVTTLSISEIRKRASEE